MTQSYLQKYGSAALDNGYRIVPIKAGQKHPLVRGWPALKATPKEIKKWSANGYSNGGFGIISEYTPGVDIDVEDPEIAEKLIDWCHENIGHAPVRIGAPPRALLMFRTDEPFTKATSTKYTDFLGQEHRVEVLGKGQQFVSFLDHPKTGRPYTWVDDRSPATVKLEDLPIISRSQIDELLRYFEEIVPSDWEVVARAKKTQDYKDDDIEPDLRPIHYATPPGNFTQEQIDWALHWVRPDCDDRDTWVNTLLGIHHQYQGSREGFDLAVDWSMRTERSNFVYDDCVSVWNSIRTLPDRKPVTFATVMKRARAYSAGRTPDVEDRPSTPQGLISLNDYQSRVRPTDWLIEGLIENDAIAQVFGESDTYKTFFAIDLGMSVAAGIDWFGRKVKQGPVIYIAGEGHNSLGSRFIAWQTDRGLIERKDIPWYATEVPMPVLDPEAVASTVGIIEAATGDTPPRMVILDTLASNFGPGDENSTQDMTAFINSVRDQIRIKFNCVVLLVHHTGLQDKDRGRGNYALRAGIEMDFKVERDPSEELSSKVTCKKMKNAERPEPFYIKGEKIFFTTTEGVEGDSLVFGRSEKDFEAIELPSLKGKQKALYDLIIHEGEIDRDKLRDVALAENIFVKARDFKDTLAHLKRKELIDENDNLISALDNFTGGAYA